MKQITSIALMVLSASFILNAQTKKVLFEEFTGAHCGNCPMGSYTMDSLLNLYPDVIGVSLHSYNMPDAMFFPQIDTIGTEYAPGAPLGAVDRIFWGNWEYVAEVLYYWNTHIQNRIALSPEVTVSIDALWDPVSRNITTEISAGFLANLQSGDYRFNLYVVEDSVIGTGSGYDQSNFYNDIPGNPFYGKGNPIVGYVHKHVVRAILPQAWGQAGIISSSPAAGQTFTTGINYTVPTDFDENKISLVGFISKFTTDHQGDEVLNVEEKKLNTATGMAIHEQENGFSIIPNPSKGFVKLKSKKDYTLCVIFSLTGKAVHREELRTNDAFLDLSALKPGMYFALLTDGIEASIQKVVIE